MPKRVQRENGRDMSSMRSRDSNIALVISDIHLRQSPPPAREQEESWFEAMARPLREVRKMAREWDVPVICAGDVFDRWRSTNELVNFALRELPLMYAIPGQHDLPEHDLSQADRSAFMTLILANKIIAPQEKSVLLRGKGGGLVLFDFFPFGEKIKQRSETDKDVCLKVAVNHQFVYLEEGKTGWYPGASKKTSRVDFVAEGSEYYDILIFGDNHMDWSTKRTVNDKKQTIINCGAIARYRSDEGERKPKAWLLKASGDVQKVYLQSTKEEVFCPVEKEREVEAEIDAQELIAELKALSDTALDFEWALRKAADQADPAVGDILLRSLEDST